MEKFDEEDNKNKKRQLNNQLDDEKEQKGEIYENSNLVENVQNLEGEDEESYLYLEGID